MDERIVGTFLQVTRYLAEAAQFAFGLAEVLPQKSFHVLLRPALPGDYLGVLRAHHDYGAVQDSFFCDLGDHPGLGHRVRDRTQNLFRNLRGAMLDVQIAAHHLHGYGAGVPRIPALDVERLPRTVFFVLSDATTIFGGGALGALIKHVRPDAEGVHDDKPQRASHSSVRPIARAEYIILTIEAELLPNRPVHNHDFSLPGGTLQQAGDHSGTAGKGVHGRDYHGEVFGFAAGHDRINRGLTNDA
jgi:hypothetical protein